VAMGQILPESIHGTLVMGELSLDGGVRHVRGVLPMTALARAEGYQTVLVPADDAREAALVPGVSVIPVSSLRQLVNHLTAVEPIAPVVVAPATSAGPVYVPTDFAEAK
jgi:magnesium chelatase family protein